MVTKGINYPIGSDDNEEEDDPLNLKKKKKKSPTQTTPLTPSSFSQAAISRRMRGDNYPT